MDLERLKAIGSEWHRDDKHRIYFNDLPSRYGLRVTRYKTGRISRASLNGEAISNNKADKLWDTLTLGKLWWDVPTGAFQSQRLPEAMVQILVASIEYDCAEVHP